MSLLHTAVGIFTISNPIGNLPIYLSFTDGNKRNCPQINQYPHLACAFGFFGISRGAFQVAGGLIVVLILPDCDPESGLGSEPESFPLAMIFWGSSGSAAPPSRSAVQCR